MLRSISTLIISVCLFSPLLVAGDFQQPIKGVQVDPLDINMHTGVKLKPELHAELEEHTFEYRWFLNGEESHFETTAVYPGSLLNRGDKLSVEITPVNMAGKRLNVVSILDMLVGNASPVITSEPRTVLAEQSYTYPVVATDPDGDSLIYSLAEAPEGMTIDPVSGKVEWPFDTLPQGVFPVHIVVEDGFGGRAEQTFELNLSLVEKETSQ